VAVHPPQHEPVHQVEAAKRLQEEDERCNNELCSTCEKEGSAEQVEVLEVSMVASGVTSPGCLPPRDGAPTTA
jgi:hypothetical protein